jgi:hypothetical protein
MPVIVRKMPDDLLADGEFRGGVMHLYDPTPVMQNNWTARGDGKLHIGDSTLSRGHSWESVIRHEYGHGVQQTLTPDQRQAWTSFWYAEKENVIAMRQGISFYASVNEQEAWAETFAIATHRDYRDDHPLLTDVTRRAIAKMRELLK